MATESHRERYVRELLEGRFGVALRRLSGSDRRTPDYELLSEGRVIAVVEVKTIEYVQRTEANGFSVTRRDAHSWEATRRDNAVSRVASHIHSAAGQLKGYAVPKMLVFLNLETHVDVGDLEEAVAGKMTYGTEETGLMVNTISRKIAEGRISEERWLVDLYVWIERPKPPMLVFPTGEEPRRVPAETEASILFRVTSDAGARLAHEQFQCPPLNNPNLAEPKSVGIL